MSLMLSLTHEDGHCVPDELTDKITLCLNIHTGNPKYDLNGEHFTYLSMKNKQWSDWDTIDEGAMLRKKQLIKGGAS